MILFPWTSQDMCLCTDSGCTALHVKHPSTFCPLTLTLSAWTQTLAASIWWPSSTKQACCETSPVHTHKNTLCLTFFSFHPSISFSLSPLTASLQLFAPLLLSYEMHCLCQPGTMDFKWHFKITNIVYIHFHQYLWQIFTKIVTQMHDSNILWIFQIFKISFLFF